jgi:hypothetical protein
VTVDVFADLLGFRVDVICVIVVCFVVYVVVVFHFVVGCCSLGRHERGWDKTVVDGIEVFDFLLVDGSNIGVRTPSPWRSLDS